MSSATTTKTTRVSLEHREEEEEEEEENQNPTSLTTTTTTTSTSTGAAPSLFSLSNTIDYRRKMKTTGSLIKSSTHTVEKSLALTPPPPGPIPPQPQGETAAPTATTSVSSEKETDDDDDDDSDDASGARIQAILSSSRTATARAQSKNNVSGGGGGGGGGGVIVTAGADFVSGEREFADAKDFGGNGLLDSSSDESSDYDSSVGTGMSDLLFGKGNEKDKEIAQQTMAGISAYIECLRRRDMDEQQQQQQNVRNNDNNGDNNNNSNNNNNGENSHNNPLNSSGLGVLGIDDDFLYLSSDSESDYGHNSDYVVPETEEELSNFISSMRGNAEPSAGSPSSAQSPLPSNTAVVHAKAEPVSDPPALGGRSTRIQFDSCSTRFYTVDVLGGSDEQEESVTTTPSLSASSSSSPLQHQPQSQPPQRGSVGITGEDVMSIESKGGTTVLSSSMSSGEDDEKGDDRSKLVGASVSGKGDRANGRRVPSSQTIRRVHVEVYDAVEQNRIDDTPNVLPSSVLDDDDERDDIRRLMAYDDDDDDDDDSEGKNGVNLANVTLDDAMASDTSTIHEEPYRRQPNGIATTATATAARTTTTTTTMEPDTASVISALSEDRIRHMTDLDLMDDDDDDDYNLPDECMIDPEEFASSSDADKINTFLRITAEVYMKDETERSTVETSLLARLVEFQTQRIEMDELMQSLPSLYESWVAEQRQLPQSSLSPSPSPPSPRTPSPLPSSHVAPNDNVTATVHDDASETPTPLEKCQDHTARDSETGGHADVGGEAETVDQDGTVSPKQEETNKRSISQPQSQLPPSPPPLTNKEPEDIHTLLYTSSQEEEANSYNEPSPRGEMTPTEQLQGIDFVASGSTGMAPLSSSSSSSSCAKENDNDNENNNETETETETDTPTRTMDGEEDADKDDNVNLIQSSNLPTVLPLVEQQQQQQPGEDEEIQTHPKDKEHWSPHMDTVQDDQDQDQEHENEEAPELEVPSSPDHDPIHTATVSPIPVPANDVERLHGETETVDADTPSHDDNDDNDNDENDMAVDTKELPTLNSSSSELASSSVEWSAMDQHSIEKVTEEASDLLESSPSYEDDADVTYSQSSKEDDDDEDVNVNDDDDNNNTESGNHDEFVKNDQDMNENEAVGESKTHELGDDDQSSCFEPPFDDDDEDDDEDDVDVDVNDDMDIDNKEQDMLDVLDALDDVSQEGVSAADTTVRIRNTRPKGWPTESTATNAITTTLLGKEEPKKHSRQTTTTTTTANATATATTELKTTSTSSFFSLSILQKTFESLLPSNPESVAEENDEVPKSSSMELLHSEFADTVLGKSFEEKETATATATATAPTPIPPQSQSQSQTPTLPQCTSANTSHNNVKHTVGGSTKEESKLSDTCHPDPHDKEKGVVNEAAISPSELEESICNSVTQPNETAGTKTIIEDGSVSTIEKEDCESQVIADTNDIELDEYGKEEEVEVEVEAEPDDGLSDEDEEEAAPEGTSVEELERLNHFIAQAVAFSQLKEPDETRRQELLDSAVSQGVPLHVLTDIIGEHEPAPQAQAQAQPQRTRPRPPPVLKKPKLDETNPEVMALTKRQRKNYNFFLRTVGDLLLKPTDERTPVEHCFVQRYEESEEVSSSSSASGELGGHGRIAALVDELPDLFDALRNEEDEEDKVTTDIYAKIIGGEGGDTGDGDTGNRGEAGGGTGSFENVFLSAFEDSHQDTDPLDTTSHTHTHTLSSNPNHEKDPNQENDKDNDNNENETDDKDKGKKPVNEDDTESGTGTHEDSGRDYLSYFLNEARTADAWEDDLQEQADVIESSKHKEEGEEEEQQLGDENEAPNDAKEDLVPKEVMEATKAFYVCCTRKLYEEDDTYTLGQLEDMLEGGDRNGLPVSLILKTFMDTKERQQHSTIRMNGGETKDAIHRTADSSGLHHDPELHSDNINEDESMVVPVLECNNEHEDEIQQESTKESHQEDDVVVDDDDDDNTQSKENNGCGEESNLQTKNKASPASSQDTTEGADAKLDSTTSTQDHNGIANDTSEAFAIQNDQIIYHKSQEINNLDESLEEAKAQVNTKETNNSKMMKLMEKASMLIEKGNYTEEQIHQLIREAEMEDLDVERVYALFGAVHPDGPGAPEDGGDDIQYNQKEAALHAFYTEATTQLTHRGGYELSQIKAMLKDADETVIPVGVITTTFEHESKKQKEPRGTFAFPRSNPNYPANANTNAKETNVAKQHIAPFQETVVYSKPKPPQNLTKSRNELIQFYGEKAEELIVNANPIQALIKLMRNGRDEGLPMVVRSYLFDAAVKHGKGEQVDISLPTLLSLVETKQKEEPIVDTKDKVDDGSVIVFTPPPKVEPVEDEVSETSSVFSENLHAQMDKFESIEDVDESDQIDAFLTRFSVLNAGGHFEKANVESIGYQIDPEKLQLKDEIEVDLKMGFVKKELHIKTPVDLDEEEKLWSEVTEKDLFKKHADFLKKLPVPVKSPNDVKDDTEDAPKQLIAEYRDINLGDAEVYLMEETEVEVAFVDEEEEMRATEKSRNKKKWVFGEEFKKSLHRKEGVVLGRNVAPKAVTASRTTYFTNSEQPKIAKLEKIFQERDAKMMGRYGQMSMFGSWMSPWDIHMTRRRRKALGPSRSELIRKQFNPTNILPSGPLIILRQENENAPPVNAVAAVKAMKKFRRRRESEIQRPWREDYNERTIDHEGFYFIDINSLYDATVVIAKRHELDRIPWEYRDVRQRFLHEKSIAYVRNWFGKLEVYRINHKIHQPISHPKSFQMPFESLPEPGEWTEDWFTTWQSRKQNPNNLKLYAQDELEGNTTATTSDSTVVSSINSVEGLGPQNSFYRPTPSFMSYQDVDGEERERNLRAHRKNQYALDEAPEVGTLCTVRLKIGEKVSRVRWNYTSSLRRSRWRRKYFPRGTFPYDDIIVQERNLPTIGLS